MLDENEEEMEEELEEEDEFVEDLGEEDDVEEADTLGSLLKPSDDKKSVYLCWVIL